ncbi:hypothetical protein ACOZ38_25380 [Sphaerisporangium viridialbum]|uniref:hypothetical protein n=1 Tax=Sphaerisporangium viridialbum TaxID=46189 RepID=UPI003C725F59
MAWFKVDDAFHSHRKVMVARPAALGLWVVAGSWSSANLTGGFIPDAILPRLMPGAKKLAHELVACGLWIRDSNGADSGFTFHDWDDYNPTADEVREDREAARQRMRNLRARRRGQAAETDEPAAIEPPDKTDNVRANSDRTTSERSRERSPSVRNPVPSRPVPETNTSSQSSIPPYRAGQTDEDGYHQVDQMISRLLAPLAAAPITPQHAAWVRTTILAKGRGRVRNHEAYIRRALQSDPHAYLPEPPTTAAAPAGRCSTHHQDEPCRSCAADRKARKDPE